LSLIRLDFRDLTLFENEEFGDSQMAMYATVRDATSGVVATFRWNNAGEEVNETNTYSLDNDPSNPNVVDVELPGVSTISIEAYIHTTTTPGRRRVTTRTRWAARVLRSIRACSPLWVR